MNKKKIKTIKEIIFPDEVPHGRFTTDFDRAHIDSESNDGKYKRLDKFTWNLH